MNPPPPPGSSFDSSAGTGVANLLLKMSSWITEKKAEVLALPVDAKILSESLVTDRDLKRKYYLNKYKTLDELPFDQERPQVLETSL